jgi:hypothetical protein
MTFNGYVVRGIPKEQTHEWLLKKHYAHRIPSITWAFGLYDNKELVGVCCYGTPSSSPLRTGVCGGQYSNIVIELNRLVLQNNKKNEASFFISKTLSLLPKPSIIISYSDTSRHHSGFIYQACNFLYTGLSAKRKDWKVKGLEHLHGKTIADISRGHEKRAVYMREMYGDDFYLEDRPRKHRYVYFLGSKKEKKEMLANLRYSIEPYPKGDNENYDASYQPKIQGVLM